MSAPTVAPAVDAAELLVDFVAGYQRAAAGHHQAFTRHMFRAAAAWEAFTAGFAAGDRYERPASGAPRSEVAARAAAAFAEWRRS